jgi:valyl-tRNA synthetase
MALSRRYNPRTAEPRLQALWEELGIYRFSAQDGKPVYSIDTPPATVSGNLHMGHTYSYTQTDFLARFWRMRGYNVFYPMGYDDNGLPTERYVEKRLGTSAREIGAEAFTEACLAVSPEVEQAYETLWKRLALSVDWRFTYRTIEARSRRISQLSFLDLYQKGLAYRQKSPAIWCPECGTAIAQAELDDLERETTFYTLAFHLQDGTTLPIATTRPELLPACVAVFVHPGDDRFKGLVGRQVRVPLFDQIVPVLADPEADPEKGTGAVMCCTFGDVTDVHWWYVHDLPLVEALAPDGRMTQVAGEWAGQDVQEARRRMVGALQDRGMLLGQQHASQSIRVHERCDTPAEYIVTQQWFIRVLEFKDELLQAGQELAWHPAHMQARYRQWVENLNWDWCISRQRAFGVPFPLWHCDDCGGIVLAEEDQLPVDPRYRSPSRPCPCGSSALSPERDVMDTWATSSLTPQIAGYWPPGGGTPAGEGLYEQVFPMSLRPQAHDIIRTWAFYTVVKSFHHFGKLPWQEIAISGWGIAGEGMGKISKSRGGGPMAPMDVIEQYSADAIRYWAASTGLGKDAVISEQKIQTGARLVNKLWNVARFGQRFLQEYHSAPRVPEDVALSAFLSPADRWIMSRLQRLVRQATESLQNGDHAAAKSETESFFWTELADNYLEMAKLRLYNQAESSHEAARYTLYHALLAVLKLLAPFLPHVTEEIYQGLFAEVEGTTSIHVSPWPAPDPALEDAAAETAGNLLVEVATAVRRYKSEHSIPLSAELARLQLAITDPALATMLQQAQADVSSITRARQVQVTGQLDRKLEHIRTDGTVMIALAGPAGSNAGAPT